MNDLNTIRNYFIDRAREVRSYADSGDPWPFLMTSPFIEYLVKMVYNVEPTTASHYKDFVRDYMSLVNPIYRDFQFVGGQQDLPEQMYHILRCGIVHSFSFQPDARALRSGGRSKAIVLAHNRNGGRHLTSFTDRGFDAIVLTAESFADDLLVLIDKIFIDEAPNNSQLKANILDWVANYLPIGPI